MLSESAYLQPQYWPNSKQPQHAYALRVSASAAAASGDICIDGLQVYRLEQAQLENRGDTELVQTRKRSAKAPRFEPGRIRGTRLHVRILRSRLQGQPPRNIEPSEHDMTDQNVCRDLISSSDLEAPIATPV